MRFFGTLASVFILTSVTAAPLTMAETHEVNGVDVTPVVQIFASHLRVVTKPFHIYHWGNDSSYYRGAILSTDAKGFDYVRRASLAFLDGLEAEDRHANRYGAGFYSSVDPITTEEYGAYTKEWILFDSLIPVGFRMLDHTQSDRDGDLSLQAENALIDAGCNGDSFYNGSNLPRALLESNQLSHKCAEVIRYVFRTLKIDGLAYDYDAQSFRGCRRTEKGAYAFGSGLAFVFTSADWLKEASQVHVFTANTTDAKPERLAIESVFIGLKRSARPPTVQEMYYSPTQAMRDEMRAYIVKKRPDIGEKFDFNVVGYDCLPNTDICTVKVKVSYLARDGAHNSSSFRIKAPKVEMPKPGVITANTKASRMLHNGGIHWQDLIGSQALSDTKSWIQENLLNCGPEDHWSALGDYETE